MNVTVNSFLLEELNTNNELRLFAVFCKIKSLFSNGCIYNYSYRSLSLKSGISINTLKKSIPFFLQKGWCRKHDRNLVFCKTLSFDKNKKKSLLSFQIYPKEQYKDTLKRLKVLLVKITYNKFEYIKKISCDNINPKNSKDLKRAKRLAKKYGIVKFISESTKFSISNKKVGLLINRSKSTGSRLMKWGCKNNLIGLQQRIVRLDAPKSFLSRTGVPLLQLTNYVSFF